MSALPVAATHATLPCSDCSNPVTMASTTLSKGSAIREPGEAVCTGCRARRNKMVRELDTIPNTLNLIQAMRMGGIRNTPKMISKESRY